MFSLLFLCKESCSVADSSSLVDRIGMFRERGESSKLA